MAVHCNADTDNKDAKTLFRNKKSQVQALAAIVFLVLIPTVIIAQNATNLTDIIPPVEGGIIIPVDDPMSDSVQENQPPSEEVLPGMPQIITGPPENESTTPEPPAGQTSTEDNTTTETPSENTTLPDNQTQQEKEDPSGLQNETENTTLTDNTTLPEGNATVPSDNQTMPEENVTASPENATLPENETQPPEPPDRPPEYAVLSAEVLSGDIVIRGQTLEVKALLLNSGTAPAVSISLEWILPEGFEIESSNNPCGTILAGDECEASAEIRVPMSAEPGEKDIGVRVSYG